MRAALLVLVLSACSSAEAQPANVEAGRRGFMTLYDVLQHPRCMNCHPDGDRPLQFDDSRIHSQNISRRSERNGLHCATCHRDKNSTRPGQPPGAPHWQLPPAETPMIFQGRTPKQLCEQLKDPKQTNGKDLAALIEHVATDPLVTWGWAPGPGRTPVPTPRAQVVAAMKTWAAAGAPCPE